MNDSPEAKSVSARHYLPMSEPSPLEKRLSSMPPEDLEPQNISYLGNICNFFIL